MNVTATRILAILGVLVLLEGCTKVSEYKAPPPPEVGILDAVGITIRDTITFTGTTRARATVDLRARVSGDLKEIRFKDGDNVDKDQVLFVIDQAPFERELEAKQAELQRSQASLTLAEANERRTEKLRMENATTQQQLDVVRAEKQTAMANVAAAEAAVKQAALNVDYTVIKAPMAGRIGRHLVDPGNLVQVGTMSLAVIEAIDPIDVYYYISESDVLRLMAMKSPNGQPVNAESLSQAVWMGLQTDSDYPYQGVLNFKELGVDPATGTILRRAEFPNPEGRLIPGLFVRLKMDVGDERERVLIEDVAIMSDQGGDSVYVVERVEKLNEKQQPFDPKQYQYVARKRLVKLGEKHNELRIVNSGLKVGDWVITSGIQRARDGAPVCFLQTRLPRAPRNVPSDWNQKRGEPRLRRFRSPCRLLPPSRQAMTAKTRRRTIAGRAMMGQADVH